MFYTRDVYVRLPHSISDFLLYSIRVVFTFVNVQETDVYVTRLLNSIGDHIELPHVLNPSQGGLNIHQSPEQLEEDIVENGHCSAMVKVRCFDLPIIPIHKKGDDCTGKAKQI